MNRFTSSKEKGHSMFAEVDDEAGRRFGLGSRQRSRRRHGGGFDRRAQSNERKACQLCRQVGHALDEILAECRDDILQNLRVLSVMPFPDASRLLVTVIPIDDRPGKALDSQTVLNHLQNAGGHLRSEVASAVTRRRAPLLVYQVGTSPF